MRQGTCILILAQSVRTGSTCVAPCHLSLQAGSFRSLPESCSVPRGFIPSDVKPLLESLDSDADAWAKNIERYGKLFYYVAGKAENMTEAAKKAGMRWVKGREGSESLYKPKIPVTEVV